MINHQVIATTLRRMGIASKGVVNDFEAVTEMLQRLLIYPRILMDCQISRH
jgi:hypothetical protein